MKTILDRVGAMLAMFEVAKYFPREKHLEEALGATPADVGHFDEIRLKKLRRAFPEMNYGDALMIKLWSLYEDMLSSNQIEPSRDAILFVHFVLSIPKYARKGKPLRVCLDMVDEGERIERALLEVR